jgi:hypothetical protein
LIDPLQSDVREDWWSNGTAVYNLSLGHHASKTQKINNITYTYSYDVSEVNFGADADTTVRKVVMQINWTE